jgi:hypothetical protein
VTDERPGATGKYPEGKLDKSDEGELTIGIDVDIHGNVRLEFGKPVAWLAMPPDAAISFGKLIINTAAKVKANLESDKGH